MTQGPGSRLNLDLPYSVCDLMCVCVCAVGDVCANAARGDPGIRAGPPAPRAGIRADRM
jgi:hypothetical protein